jgi:hypothetical protein
MSKGTFKTSKDLIFCIELPRIFTDQKVSRFAQRLRKLLFVLYGYNNYIIINSVLQLIY